MSASMRQFTAALALGLLALLPIAARGGSLRGAKVFVGFVDEYPVNFVYFVDPSAAYYADVEKAVRSVAVRYAEKDVAFVKVERQMSGTLNFFQLREDQTWPFAAAMNWTNGVGDKPVKKFMLLEGEGNFTPDAMEKSLESFYAGKLKAWIRSSPVVMDRARFVPGDGAMEIVGSQFDDEVAATPKDSFVMMFAAWCGWSKRMSPMFDDVARHLSHVTTLDVLKIDASENDIDHPVMSHLKGYPFLAFFPAGNKENAVHLTVKAGFDNATHWREEAVKLLRQHATHPIEEKPADAAEGLDEADSGLLAEEEF